MVSRSIIALSFLILAAYSTPTPKKLRATDEEYRLPTNVVPTNYKIELTFPDAVFGPDGTDFTGSATIQFDVVLATTEIKLHLSPDYITITQLTIVETVPETEEPEQPEESEPEVDTLQTITDYSTDPITEILTIPTAGISMEIGKSYTMVITYTGKISTTDNNGLYKSSYTNANKETVYLLATQFQTTYARRAFPCFDEPAFKATYDVTVIYPATRSLNVLFNTAMAMNTPATEGVITEIFATTPKMSSYLVALVVSDFTSTELVNVPGDTTVAHRIWSQNGLAASRAYAQSAGPLILQQLSAYTGRLYSQDISKVDQVAIPDFSAGAMENWGLVTYRERLLLWNTDDSSTAARQTISTIIAHELAHQWFGNVITCNWWSETFLNEGFATYFEYFITHLVNPTWQLDQQFVVDVLQDVLQSDASAESQALQSDAFTPLQIQEKFGTISYKKGGSIIRMLTHIMGEENFKAGIQAYFQNDDRLHGTSVPSQLWEILQASVNEAVSQLEGVTLTTVMQNWVEKAGYPLVTVSLDGTSLKISQERFLLTGEDTETKWHIPITYAESESATKFQDTKPVVWLTPEVPETTLTLDNENTWVILNSLQTGYYRVNYDETLWANIVAALQTENFGDIVELNRAQIVDDLFSLAQAHKLTYSRVLGSLEFLKSDDAYIPWVPAFKGFRFMLQRIPEGTEIRRFVEEHLLNLIDKVYQSVSFDEISEDQIYSARQVLAISWACTLGVEDCITKVQTAFSGFKTDGTKPNKNLKSVIYCNALRNSDDATDYDFLWNLYGETEIPTEKNTILNSLGCSKNEEKLTELLAEAVKVDSSIRTQDSLTAFAAVYGGSQTGAGLALDFLINNLAAVLAKFPATSSRRSLIAGIAGKLTTDEQLEKLKTLIETNAAFPDDLKADAAKAVAQAQSNIEWVADHQADLEGFYRVVDPTTAEPDGASSIHTNMALLIVVGIVSILSFFKK